MTTTPTFGYLKAMTGTSLGIAAIGLGTVGITAAIYGNEAFGISAQINGPEFETLATVSAWMTLGWWVAGVGIAGTLLAWLGWGILEGLGRTAPAEGTYISMPTAEPKQATYTAPQPEQPGQQLPPTRREQRQNPPTDGSLPPGYV